MTGIDWREEAKKSGLPTFPIRITCDEAGKWRKRPLTRNGHLDAKITASGIDGFDWTHANGFGLAMGAFASQVGWYGFDVDRHKGAGVEEAAFGWLKAHGATLETRRHGTVSGGLHLIYLLPGRFANLPSRGNIVLGLDSRGEGGWIAYGEGYSVEDDRPPATLSTAACEEVMRGYSGGLRVGGGAGGEVELPDLEGVDPKAAFDKLLLAIGRGRVGLLLAWRGERRHRTGDESRSAADHAVAFHMALAGLGASEIACLLLHAFRHGACSDATTPYAVRLRAAQRSAAKSVAYVEAQREALREELVRHSEEAAEAFARSLE